ncbi:hypothetical protein KTD31_01695 [Burkholderia multivorans]|jgi:hypothetical protein|uniref:hypothetical protein n=1 Tax=Burkholderia multivorans TaxID=87883 RepID=UPI001C243050|nr:hypothetical protein [Burkholderia multivorans]MBU9200116.1 hypothetical protein [Burkholderia multivorans]MDN8078762.1 hypothetical protein [Burkholderia multivorans]
MSETRVLTADTQAVALRTSKDMYHAIGTVISTVSGEEFNRELAVNALKVAEFSLMKVCETLGIELDSIAEREERYARLRAANMRIRELEAQLGNEASPERTQLNLKVMSRRLNDWWDLEGFGHIQDIAFKEYGCDVTFSCSLFGDFSLTMSKTPVSDKERKQLWLQSLRDRGFDLVNEDRDMELEDTEASRKALCKLLKERLPSADVLQLENHNRRKSGSFVLRSVRVYIRDIQDILALPQKEKTE